MEKEKIDKKDHILDVAERVFSELGFDGASTRLISSEAGVNMAMLNYYFGSKEGLFVAIFERRVSTLYTQLSDINKDSNCSGWEKIERYLDTYLDRVFKTNCFQKMLQHEMSMTRRSELSDKLTHLMMQNVNEFRRILHEGIEKGEFARDTDTDMVVSTVFGIKNHIIHTPKITSVMLGYDVMEEQNMQEKLKPRVKSYLKKLLKAYLLTDNDNSN